MLLVVPLAGLLYLVLRTGAFGAPELRTRGLASFFGSFLVIILLLGAQATYLTHVVAANPRLSDVGRVAWGIAILALNVVAMPVYWLLYLR